MPSAQEVGALPNTYTPPIQTAEQVGADPKGTAATAVSQHNTADDSHNDIRLELKAINDKLTAFFDSDNQTLDELSEIVAYITSNKSLIDSITTSKVSVADIVNNLTSNVSNKPLSAAQGVVLKGLIDTLSNNLANYQPKGDYALRSELPNVPTKLSAFTNDSGFITDYTETDPTVPAWAKAASKPTYTASEVGALPDTTIIPTVPTKVSAFTNDAGYLTEHQDISGKADKSQGVFYIEGDSNSTTDTTNKVATWIGSHDEITEYFSGLTILYKVITAGSTTTTLNINNLGAVTVVRNATTGISTSCPVNGVLLLTYTVDSDGTAYWKTADYDANTKNTAGTSNKTGTKLFLAGGASQSSSGVTTYSNKNVYIGTDNCLYSNGEKVATSDEVSDAASTAVSTHNSDTSAHADIRNQLSQLSENKLDKTVISTAVNDALAQAKASGEFDGEDGYSPVRGVDYYTDADKSEFSEYIASELAKRGQLKPEFANSIEECADTTKMYVLPDGYIYAYVKTFIPGGPAYTNLLPTAVPSVDPTETELFANNGGKGYITGYRRSSSSGKVSADSIYSVTGLMPMNKADVIRVKNITPLTASGSGNVQFFSPKKDPAERYLAKTIWETDFPKHLVNDVYVFDIDESSLIGVTEVYFSIGTGNINDSTIITVNEEIIDNPDRYESAWTNTGHAFVPADYEDRIVSLEKFAEEIDEKIENVVEKVANSFDYTAYGLPVLYLNGDTSLMNKDTKVTLDYVYGERTGTCSVKWQGSSSIVYPKKNYTVTFDNAFEAVAGWGEQKKYCMKANFMDFSHSRNLCCAKLWGQVVKSRTTANEALNALPNGGAVDGFPIVIVINGVYQGIYTFNIPKDGWMFGMGSGTNEAILCADQFTLGSLATIFENEALCDGTDFEIEYVPDEDNTSWVVESINRLIRAVLASDGTDIDTAIAQYLDIDSAIDYLLFTQLVQGADMVKKNYIIATYDGVKWFFSAYDMDSTFGITWHAGYYGDKDCGAFKSAIGSAEEQFPVMSSMKTHKLFKLLIEHKQDRIKARYNALRAGAMSEANIAHEFNEFTAMIPKPYFDEEPLIWPTIPATAANNANQIVTHYMLRTPKVDSDVNGL